MQDKPEPYAPDSQLALLRSIEAKAEEANSLIGLNNDRAMELLIEVRKMTREALANLGIALPDDSRP